MQDGGVDHRQRSHPRAGRVAREPPRSGLHVLDFAQRLLCVAYDAFLSMAIDFLADPTLLHHDGVANRLTVLPVAQTVSVSIPRLQQRPQCRGQFFNHVV